MKYKIVRWYDERKTVTHIHSFEEAYQEYSKNSACDTVQVYVLTGNPEKSILLAQKEC